MFRLVVVEGKTYKCKNYNYAMKLINRLELEEENYKLYEWSTEIRKYVLIS